jgi:hypothetical protein
MYWRYGLCFLAVVWFGFAVCGQLLAAEMQGGLKAQLAKDPQRVDLLIESANVSVEFKDVELAKSKEFFLRERVDRIEVGPEDKLAYEKLQINVEDLEQKFLLLSERQDRLGGFVSKYPEHRDLLYLQGINEYNLMDNEHAVARVEQALDLDPLYTLGWDTLNVIKSKE